MASVLLLPLIADAQSVTLTRLNNLKPLVGANFSGVYSNTQIRAALSGSAFVANNLQVTLAQVGSIPGLTMSFSTNNFTNSQNVVLTLAVTNIPKGQYTISIEARTNGVALASLDIPLVAGALWVNADPNSPNWNSSANWSIGAAPGINDDVMFQDAGSSTNYVESSYTVSSLSFLRSLSGTNQNMTLAPGARVLVSGTNGFQINNDTLQSSGKTLTVNVAGSGSSLVGSNTAANISFFDVSSGSSGLLLNMTNLGRFEAHANRFGIGDVTLAESGGTGPQLVNVSLAMTNIIRATFSGTDFSLNNTNNIPYAFSMLNNSDSFNNGSASTINFGISNAVFADTVGMSQSRNGSAANTLRFNPVFTNLNTSASLPYASFRSASGGRVSLISVGVDAGLTVSGSNAKGAWNFNSGYLDILADTLWLGRNRFTNNSNANPIGTLSFTEGVLDVNTARLGYQAYTNDSYANGTITVGGGPRNATLRVNQDLNLGFTSGDGGTSGSMYRSSGTVIVNSNGVVRASQITLGIASTNNTITINNGGVLSVTNLVGTSSKYLSRLTVNGGSGTGAGINLFIDGTNTKIYASNLVTAVSGNYLNIVSVANVSSYPITIPVIKYDVPSTAAFSAGSVNAGIVGLTAQVINNTANNTIDVTLTTNAPKVLVWKGTVNNNWDTSTKNWLDVATGILTNFVIGDLVQFDDTASQATVNVTEDVAPGQGIGVNGISMTNSTLSYAFTGSGRVLGSTTFVKAGSGTLVIGNSFEATLVVLNGSATCVGTLGAADVAPGSTFSVSSLGQIVGAVAVSGVCVNDGIISGGLSLNSGAVVTNNSGGSIGGPLSIDSSVFLNNKAGATITSSSTVTVATNSFVLNGGVFKSQAMNVNGTLEDLGTGYIGVVGTLTINGGGTFIPGGDGIGTSTVKETSINDPLTAGTVRFLTGSTNLVKVDWANSQPYSKLLANTVIFGASQASKSFNGGTILITNIGATPFSAGQTLKLFGTTPSDGSFVPSLYTLNTTNSYSVMIPSAPGNGLGWDLGNLYYDGVVAVKAVPTTPTNVTYSASFLTTISTNVPPVTNNYVVSQLSWPEEYIGWRLQQQQNTLDIGLSTNWTDVFTSWTNQVTVTNVFTTNAVFFRMVYP